MGQDSILVDVLQAVGLKDGERYEVAKIDTRGKFSARRFVVGQTHYADFVKGAHNAWICPNPLGPVTGKRARAGDVLDPRWLLVDIDPEKSPEDPDGLDLWKRQAAGEAARKVFAALSGVLIDGGRGWQVWLRVAKDVDRRGLLFGVREYVGQVSGVKVDATHDRARLHRLPGTINGRTGNPARIVEVGDPDPIPAASPFVLADEDEDDDPISPADWSEPSQGDRVWLRGKALELWETRPQWDRSQRDFEFVRALLGDGAPLDTVSRLLWSLPEGKASTDKRGEGYWESAVKWARKDLNREQRLTVQATDIADTGTPEQVFAPENLRAFAYLRDRNPVAWIIVRAKLGAMRGVPIKAVEDAMRELGRRDSRDLLKRVRVLRPETASA